MKKKDKTTKYIQEFVEDSIGKVKFVKLDYLYEPKELTDGFYGLRPYGKGRQAFIKFIEKSSYSYHPRQDLSQLKKHKYALFPSRRGIEGFLFSEHTDVGLSLVFERLFHSDLSAIFKIKEGSIECALINMKKMKAEKKFWGFNLKNYQEDLEITKRRDSYWGYQTDAFQKPHHFLLEFHNIEKLKFTAFQTLKSLKAHLFSCEGEGNLDGPEWSDIYECNNSSRFYKKWHLEFKSHKDRMRLQKKINYSVHGYPLNIDNFSNGLKSGWCVQLRDRNCIDPKKFNYANLLDETKKEIRQASHYCNGKKHGRQILYYACGGPSRIDEFDRGMRHGLSIKFKSKNKLNADKFIYDPSDNKTHEHIQCFDLYESGKKVINPFVIASTAPNQTVKSSNSADVYNEHPDADLDHGFIETDKGVFPF